MQAAVLIREDMRGELEAITMYEAHAAQVADPRIRERLLEIANDEREHFAELTACLLRLDPRQNRLFQQAQC